MNEYSCWKEWDEDDFGCPTIGDYVYFKKIFKLANVNIEGKRVLEIGFGNGQLMGLLKKLKPEKMVGVEQINLLVERATNHSFEAYHGKLTDIDELTNIEFDIIIAIDVLEHLEYGELVELFNWIKSHLSKSGTFISRFPEGSSALGLRNQNGDFTHKTSLTETKLDFLAKQSGLSVDMYFDDLIYSNYLSKMGILGSIIFKVLDIHTFIVRFFLKLIFYPITTSLKLTANSIVIIRNK